jgi:RNA polymerase-binding transcription factor DksA
MDHDAATARLAAERAATMQRLATMGDELAAVAAAAAGSNLDDEHDPEGSTIAFEREQLAALRAHAQAQLRELDAALDRVRDGRYGRCETCGRPIGDARLDALPAARLCVTCAVRAGSSR